MPRAPQNKAKMGPGGVPKGLLALLGPFWCAPGCSWAPLGALLAALRADLGPSWGLLGRSWDLLSRSWGSCWPPGELFLELFGSLFFNALGKKRKPRFLLTVHHSFRFFELPGGKKTSKKPFRFVNYEVLVGEHVKSFGLAAFLDDNPRPNRDSWRSQSAFPRFLRIEMVPKSPQKCGTTAGGRSRGEGI